MNVTDIINYILSTETIEDLPAIMDAITERVATEMWLTTEPVEETPIVEEAPITEEAPVAAPAWEMPAGGMDLSQLSL